MSENLEQVMQEGYKEEALEGVKEEYAKYFETLQKHPRLLVGEEVPNLKGEGTETLRSAEDAREWQEAVKHILADEVRSRMSHLQDANMQLAETLHGAVDLFKNNPDLVPGTTGFDRELADAFAEMARDYEHRVDGRLLGYTIPVQSLINGIRSQLVARRSQAPDPTPAPAQKQQQQQPQAGMRSKAGTSSDDSEDFSTLFGTLGVKI